MLISVHTTLRAVEYLPGAAALQGLFHSVEWMIQSTDLHALASILLYVVPLVALPLNTKRSFSIILLLSTSAAMKLNESMLPLLNKNRNDHSYGSSTSS